MEEKMRTYLEDIGIGSSIKKRVGEIYKFYKDICPEEVTRIFVTEYISEEGARIYENLLFFSENYAMEAKDFLNKDDFDMTLLEDVTYWDIEKKNYDFETATETSSFYLNISLTNDRYCEFKASKNNCDYLKALFLECFLPKFEKSSVEDEKI